MFLLINERTNEKWTLIPIQVLPTEIGYRTLKILIQYMYSGEATVTNDQLEGVLKAGDILRVRGLWRSNAGGSSSKKENIQSNNQKVERDKREQQPIPGQLQKIKLIQPAAQQEKIVETVGPPPPPQSESQQQPQVETSVETPEHSPPIVASPVTTGTAQPPVSAPASKTVIERNTVSKAEEQLCETNNDMKQRVLEDNKLIEQNKNKENLETNGKKRRSINSDVESNKSRSEVGDHVKHPNS